MKSSHLPSRPREDNPVIFLEISVFSDDSNKPEQEVLGRLYFELRQDIVPLACDNFLQLVIGDHVTGAAKNNKIRSIAGRNHVDSEEDFAYHFKGTVIHRVTKDIFFQGGDLRGTSGDFSRSIFYHPGKNSTGLFDDESFILRHTGPGCISYCNRGPNTNGSLFQCTFSKIEDLDDKYVVFGCLVTPESFSCLELINQYGSKCGNPKELIVISDCGKVFPSR